MATIGLSKPYYAIYANNGSSVTRSNGGVMGKYTKLSISLNGGNDNVLYGDNAPAESDNTFSGGTATLGTTELMPDIAQAILGVSKEAIGTTPTLETKDAFWNVYDDNQAAPYIAVGGILKKKVDGAIKWVAFVLEKVQFTTPGTEATTQGETIEWQTPELEATIMRSDAPNHPWFRQSSLLDSEADAETLVKSYLNITDAQPDAQLTQAKSAAAKV